MKTIYKTLLAMLGMAVLVGFIAFIFQPGREGWLLGFLIVILAAFVFTAFYLIFESEENNNGRPKL